MSDKTEVLYLRTSSRLKKRLKAIASENDMSLNELINVCLDDNLEKLGI